MKKDIIFEIFTVINTISIILIIFMLKKIVINILKKDYYSFKNKFDEKLEIIKKIEKHNIILKKLKESNLSDKEIQKQIENSYSSIKTNIINLSLFCSKKTMKALSKTFPYDKGIDYIHYMSHSQKEHKKNMKDLKNILKDEIS